MVKRIVFSLIFMSTATGLLISSEGYLTLADLEGAGLDQDEIAEILAAQEVKTEAEKNAAAQALESVHREIAHRHRLAETIHRTEKVLSSMPEDHPVRASIKASNERTKNRLTELLEEETQKTVETQQAEREQEAQQMRRLTEANAELDQLKDETAALDATVNEIERAERTPVASLFSRLFGQ